MVLCAVVWGLAISEPLTLTKKEWNRNWGGHACPSTWEVAAEGSGVKGQWNEFETSRGKRRHRFKNYKQHERILWEKKRWERKWRYPESERKKVGAIPALTVLFLISFLCGISWLVIASLQPTDSMLFIITRLKNTQPPTVCIDFIQCPEFCPSEKKREKGRPILDYI